MKRIQSFLIENANKYIFEANMSGHHHGRPQGHLQHLTPQQAQHSYRVRIALKKLTKRRKGLYKIHFQSKRNLEKLTNFTE
jgi:hypothetical protein